MSKYPKSWPVGGHPEAEAKVRQLQKIGPKWLRASGPGWVAENQGRLSNIKVEENPGFVLVMFEGTPKYKAPPPWDYEYMVVVGGVLPSASSNWLGIIYVITYVSGVTDFVAAQFSDDQLDEAIRDVTQTNSCYVRRIDDIGNISFEYVGPIQNFPGLPGIDPLPDTENGGFSWFSTSTGKWVSHLYIEPVLTAPDYKPTKHTVFIDPKSLALSKYETTYTGEGTTTIRRNVAVADRFRNIYFASYVTSYVGEFESCKIRPKDGYPTATVDFDLYDEPSVATGWSYPLSPWHLYLDETGVFTVRITDNSTQRAQVVKASSLSKPPVVIKSSFDHESSHDPSSSALVWDTSTVDVSKYGILAKDEAASYGAGFVLYSKTGKKRFEFLFPSESAYNLPVGKPKAASLWRNKIAVLVYRNYSATDYGLALCGWDVAEQRATWLPGTANRLPPDFEIPVWTPTSTYVCIGITFRENKIFLLAIENWSQGDVLAGAANINRPVVFVYKWGGELVKKIDLFTELEIENAGYIDSFLSDAAHAIYGSPF